MDLKIVFGQLARKTQQDKLLIYALNHFCLKNVIKLT